MRIVLKKHTGIMVHWGKDDALAEKFGGDRVEIVNRGHWEA